MFSAFCYYQLQKYDNTFRFLKINMYVFEQILCIFDDFQGIFVSSCSGRTRHNRVTAMSFSNSTNTALCNVPHYGAAGSFANWRSDHHIRLLTRNALRQLWPTETLHFCECLLIYQLIGKTCRNRLTVSCNHYKIVIITRNGHIQLRKQRHVERSEHQWAGGE